MNKNSLITSVVVIGGLTALYFAFIHKGKKWAIKTIIETGNYSLGKDGLSGFDTPYLKAWGLSAKQGNPTFFYQGKEYVTKGGRIKQ
jgi:hypothetical protein